MNRIEVFAQKYIQAPWRTQLQFIGVFSLLLVFIGLIAGIFLSVSARAATVGRDIQSMQEEIEILNLEIEDMQSRLAMILSSTEMETRARAMGLKPVDSDRVLYLNVPGYIARQPAVLAPYSERVVVSAPVVPSEYTESLFVWIKRKAIRISYQLAEVQP